ncbi:MAG: glycosyltransferase N-terminal domain-containing protein [Bacteroidia bacterium]
MYSIISRLFPLLFRFLALFNKKAARGLRGRRGNFERIKKAISDKPGKWIWLHAASLGEFEQGRPLMEKIRNEHPEYRWLLTFFSPSGYEIRKDWSGADCVAYLPFDTPAAMRKLVELVQPETVFIVKYELWLNWLSVLGKKEIPTLLIAASMQPDSGYFRWPLRAAYKKALAGLTAIFTQNEETALLLEGFSGGHNVHRSGDPRYDRTRATREGFRPVLEIERWANGRFCLMVGSSWPEDEALLFEAFERLKKEREDICLVLAPHEIDDRRIEGSKARFPGKIRRWTAGSPQGGEILWIDTIGMLARLYHYADVAYIGGGFRKGLHNILEAVAFGCPVAFGPQHGNRPEAAELMLEGEGTEVHGADDLVEYVRAFWVDSGKKENAQILNRNFVDRRSGATEALYDFWKKLQTT